MTNDAVLARPDFVDAARELLAHAGTDVALHLRGAGIAAARLWVTATMLARRAEQSSTNLIINDRIDIALACGASGVHLGERAMDSARARAFMGPERTVGRSVHSVAGARDSGDGTDYVFLGTILRSRSHAGATPLGLGTVRTAAVESRIPVIAIGGIGIEHIADVMAHGAWGVAMISTIWDARDRVKAMQDARRELRECAERRGMK